MKSFDEWFAVSGIDAEDEQAKLDAKAGWDALLSMNPDNQTYEDLILANEKLEAENKRLQSLVADRDAAEFDAWAEDYFLFYKEIGKSYAVEKCYCKAAWMAARGR